MKITVVGAGYVGLSLATFFSVNHETTILDINENKVKKINKRIVPFADSDIEDYFKTKRLKLVATTNREEAYKNAEVVFIAVPTNLNNKTKRLDLSVVESVIQEIASFNNKVTIVIKSTVSVGFTNSIANKYPNIQILFSPEFLREGKALHDNLYPSRIIVGYSKKTQIEAAKTIANLLKECAMNKNVETLVMGASEAESVKLFANTYLASRIAFFNELDIFASTNHLNTKDIIEGVGLDPRIGSHYNNPSFGYGGYCLPKDSEELKGELKPFDTPLIKTISEANKKRLRFIVDEIEKRVVNIDSKQKVIGIYRVVTKKDSKEIRNSAAIEVIKALKKKGLEIIIYEPNIRDKLFLGCMVINSFYEFVSSSSWIVANRRSKELDNVSKPVFSRDIFERD